MEESAAASVADFLQLLEEHKKNCEASGKYIEADIAKKRLEELREHEDNRREESLRSRQVAQRLGIEEAHMLEFQQFNAMWDRTMKEYEERASELLEAMRQRHELDLRDLRSRHGEQLARPKHSPKLLDLRRIEQTLAKQGEYAEAQRVKLRADELEVAERERCLTDGEARLVKMETAFLQRQDQEVNALRQRIQTGAEEQRVARQQDLERLLRRYHNIKAELESQQNAARLRQKKGLSSLPGALGSRGFARAASALTLGTNHNHTDSRASIASQSSNYGGSATARPATASERSATSSRAASTQPRPGSAAARPGSATARNAAGGPIWRG